MKIDDHKTFEVKDFPKLHSPFERKEMDIDHGDGNTEKDAYCVTPKINEGYEWVFEEADKVKAVEKLDGTNMSIVMKNGKPEMIFARIGPNKINRIPVFSKNTQHKRIIEGVMNAYHRGWLDTLEDGQHFGELIGPKFGTDDQGDVNPYDMEEHVFYPFARARDKLEMESYGEYGTSYEDIRNWFMDQGLIPLFSSSWHGESFEETLNHTEEPEGVIFYHPETGEMAKLRRDMFPSFQGERH